MQGWRRSHFGHSARTYPIETGKCLSKATNAAVRDLRAIDFCRFQAVGDDFKLKYVSPV
jgi:hypothetical protein